MDIQLNSAGCMNKGFILDGYPRSKGDAKAVFMKQVPLPMEEPAEGEEPPEQ
jgi:adenylate kinase family enzyme